MAGYKPSTSTIPVQESRHTVFIDASIKQEHVGCACTVVAGGTEMIVKLAGDGDPIFGQITVVEIPTNPNARGVAQVTIMGGYRLNCAKNAAFKIGDTIVGAANGLVKQGVAASTDFRLFVSEVDILAEGIVGLLKL